MEILAKGQVLATGDFAPFGQMLSKGSQSAANSVPFTGGEQHDTETGLDTYKFRSYNSKLGRWMSPDPSGEHYANLDNPQSFNLYTYVINDPLKYLDQLGLEAKPEQPPCSEKDPDCSGDGGGGGSVDCDSDDTACVTALLTRNRIPIRIRLQILLLIRVEVEAEVVTPPRTQTLSHAQCLYLLRHTWLLHQLMPY